MPSRTFTKHETDPLRSSLSWPLSHLLHYLTLVAFNVYDVDRDGFISNGELFLVLKMMVGNNLKVCTIP